MEGAETMKKRKKSSTAEKLILVTAIIDIIIRLYDLIEKLTE